MTESTVSDRLAAISQNKLPGMTYDRPKSEQFRLVRLQLYNWGTFQDYHDIPVSAEGFLITGHSGSGKTTILDAISTILIPRRFIEYNWAARDVKRRDRSLESYVKGAWNSQSDDRTGEVKVNYLRDQTTWSAIAMTFKRKLGTLTLLQVFWLTRTGQTEARRHHFIFERDVDLSELSFGELDLNVPRLLEKMGDYWHESKDFPSYCEKFRARLGIANETTLKLLQKTQSMKNIEDLHSFLTEYMLDEPTTFEEADSLCNDFSNLKRAYDAVVSTERQIEVLGGIRGEWAVFQKAQAGQSELEALMSALTPFISGRVIALCEARVKKALEDEEAALNAVVEAQKANDEAIALLDALKEERRSTGGQRIEKWERSIGAWQETLEKRRAVCDQAREAFRALSWKFKDGDRKDYEEAKTRAAGELASVKEERQKLRPRLEELAISLHSARRALQEAQDDLSELKKASGNIPAPLTRLRGRLAGELGLSPDELPFVGELIDLKPDELAWRAAAERALHDLALTVVVADPKLQDFVRLASDGPLGERLAWLGAEPPEKAAKGSRPAGGKGAGKEARKGAGKEAGNDAGKREGDIKGGGTGKEGRKLQEGLALKEGEVGSGGRLEPGSESSEADGRSLASKLAAKRGWQALLANLAPRLDFACVGEASELDFHPKAVTADGLVKIDEELYLKDDRSDPADALNRVLGFDNKLKKAAYERLVKKLAAEAKTSGEELDGLYKLQTALEARRAACEAILRINWADLDTWAVQEQINDARAAINNELRSNDKLKDLDRQIKTQTRLSTEAREKLVDAEAGFRVLKKLREDLEGKLDDLRNSKLELVGYEAEGRLAALLSEQPDLTLENHAEIKDRIRQGLVEAHLRLVDKKNNSHDKIIRNMTEYRRSWEAESHDLEISVNYVPEYLERLRFLEIDSLPMQRQNFSNLLNRQTHEHLTLLRNRFKWERREIGRRVELVNESLSNVVYGVADNATTRLKLKMDNRTNDEINEFKNELQDLAGDRKLADRKADEEYFLRVEGLVSKLTNPAMASWRKRVLDVRDHVRFTGVELDESGKEVESYQSGSGKSGGQRQKLAATCLAAALRYQLGGKSLGYPVYGLVVFDEAFDKLDNESTMVVMSIFKRLSFQMILATPLKGVRAAESYIGGATVVSIKERQNSFVTMIMYDADRHRLLWEEDQELIGEAD